MKKRTVQTICLLLFLLAQLGCQDKKKINIEQDGDSAKTMRYATGLSIETAGDITVLTVNDPWPNATKPYTYALIPRTQLPRITYSKDAYDVVVPTPINSLVVTSTTHIPALEVLGGLSKLVGFPNTEYISSMPARKRISNGKIQDLGTNESLNTEMVLDLRPDVVVGFAINNENSSYDLLQKAGIPVLFNGDWTEQTPLGKAEWIKFFGALLGKGQQADSIFKNIEASYQKAVQLATHSAKKPTVISGALYKDVWYAPAGESWAAKFIEDANANYLWSQTKGSGSLSLSLENTLEQGQNADFWIAPGQFSTYQELEQANGHYPQFDAFRHKKVYGISATKGPTGGLLYYELAPQRPDLVLKDLVHIFHKELLPNHVPFFFRPLEE